MRLLTTSPCGVSAAVPCDRARLIIVEYGAGAFEPPVPPPDAAPEVVVLLQAKEESPDALAQRVERRIETLERDQRVVTEAIIALCAGDDLLIIRARERLTRALLAHQIRAGRGAIVLAADLETPAHLRAGLLELAGALTSEAGARAVGVRVLFSKNFAGPELESGTQSSPLELNLYAS